MRNGLVLAALLAAGCASAPARPTTSFEGADTVRTATLAQGVTHMFVHHPAGPWAIHVVSIDTALCSPVLRARKPGRTLADRATTTAIAGDALAAINADFFMLPGGTPVGAHVEEGIPLIGPTDRQVFAITAQGWEVGRAAMHGHARVRGDSVRMVQVNRPAAAFSSYSGTRDGVTLVTSWIGDTVHADTASTRLILRRLDGNEARGRAVVTGLSDATRARFEAGTVLLNGHGAANAWVQRRQSGDTVSWSTEVRVSGRVPAREVVGGFPELIRDGRDVLAEQTVRPDFGAARHPRTAIGWRGSELLLVVVDGRQPPYSNGMSLDELTWLFHRLGATHALNLDGGGSTALVIRGAPVNRPSDTQGERAVGNALVLQRCGRDR